MTALEVLNAVMISKDTPNWFGATGNNFIDDNYIYIRGYNKVQQVAIFAVFNRFTYEYIRTIGWNGGSGTLGSYSTPFTGEMVRFGQYFMAALGDANVIQVCKINYDSFGKPSSFSGIGQTYYYTGNASANAFWGDDNDNVYVLWTISTNSFGMERKKFDRSNGKLTLVASNNLTNVTVPSIRSLWCVKYKFDNKNLILIAFGNGSSSNSMVINYDDLTVHQYVNGAVLMKYPLFDYQNKNLMYIQPYTITGYQIDGNGYDILQEYRLIDGKWKGSNICVPAIKYMNQNDFGRTLYAGDQYGYIRDGKVYVTAFSRHFRLLTKSNIISHYKEVLK
ncbi:hypothetical protein [Lysinibacillus sp. C5.1]|uniref:hypothetical protein n=1 Tax=Lysinibacillus sp. C5.1 TaxID=2796169 RepID=UPI003081CE03